MHAWMWAEMYPDLMDGVVAISCQPVEISGRNWLGPLLTFWRQFLDGAVPFATIVLQVAGINLVMWLRSLFSFAKEHSMVVLHDRIWVNLTQHSFCHFLELCVCRRRSLSCSESYIAHSESSVSLRWAG
jgi:pimeloyl-ACP methyl ester carboxylesterase